MFYIYLTILTLAGRSHETKMFDRLVELEVSQEIPSTKWLAVMRHIFHPKVHSDCIRTAPRSIQHFKN